MFLLHVVSLGHLKGFSLLASLSDLPSQYLNFTFSFLTLDSLSLCFFQSPEPSQLFSFLFLCPRLSLLFMWNSLSSPTHCPILDTAPGTWDRFRVSPLPHPCLFQNQYKEAGRIITNHKAPNMFHLSHFFLLLISLRWQVHSQESTLSSLPQVSKCGGPRLR